MRGLLMFLILLPVVDLALLGHWLGFWNTLLLVLGTACLGVALIRYQGLAALKLAQQKLQAGVMPISEVTTGFFLAFAGLLFMHPGLITDVLGLLCLVPGIRTLLAAWMITKVAPLGFVVAGKGHGSPGSESVIEGECEQIVPAEDDPKDVFIKQEKK